MAADSKCKHPIKKREKIGFAYVWCGECGAIGERVVIVRKGSINITSRIKNWRLPERCKA